MSGWLLSVFEDAQKNPVEGMFKILLEDNTLVFESAGVIPKVVEYLDDYLCIKLSDKFYGCFVTEDLEPDGWFTNPAVLCEDGNYYFYNVHSYVPKYVKPMLDYSDPYPESLSECVEVVVR